MAEDSEPDVLLIREALSLAEIPPERIQVARDGEKAIRLFEQLEDDATPVCPDLVLLDINLPKKKGADILRRIRTSTKCPATKVLIVTSSDLQRDREQMERLGANGYFRKPSDYAAFMELGRVARNLLGQDEVSGDGGIC